MPKCSRKPGALAVLLGTGIAVTFLFATSLPPRAWAGAPAAAVAKSPATSMRTGLESLERLVQSFELPNGLKFLFVERHQAPVFSFETRVNSGASSDQIGTTGLAHMMEHMAFKGTAVVGTTDYAAEKPALEAVDRSWAAYLSERRKGILADSSRLAGLRLDFQKAQESARHYVVSNGFSRLLEQNGVPDLNAYTASDATVYLYSMPSNRLELWALLEGSRLAHPVFREFYKEREVVHEERRMNYESSPTGRLYLEFIHAAFIAHPYGFSGIGHASDLETFSREQGEAFYRRNYVAKNMCVGVVGDVTAPQLEAYAHKYFAEVSDAPAPPPVDTEEPQQLGERRVTIEDQAQPVIFIGWHCPAVTEPAYPAYEALGNLLAGGDFARLPKKLVKEMKLAVSVDYNTDTPGEKYPHLFFLSVTPAPGHDPREVEQGVYHALDEIMATSPFTAAELAGFKTRSRAGMISEVESNASLATALTHAQTLFGDWHQFFRRAERMNSLTPEDVMAAMKHMMIKSNRTVGLLVNPEGPASNAGGH